MGFIRDRKKARRRANEAQNVWDDVQLPTANERLARGLTRGASQTGPSQASSAFANTSDIANQQRAMQGLQDIYSQGGYTGAERAQMRQAQRDIGQRARQQRQASMAQAARRGMSGGGAELASILGANQAARQAEGASADAITAGGMNRAMQALGASGDLASQMRGQGFGEAFQRGTAADQMAQFNAAARNQAAAENLRNRQLAEMSNASLDARNAQRNFQNQMSLQGARSNAALGAANQYGQLGSSGMQGMLTGVGQVLDFIKP